MKRTIALITFILLSPLAHAEGEDGVNPGRRVPAPLPGSAAYKNPLRDKVVAGSTIKIKGEIYPSTDALRAGDRSEMAMDPDESSVQLVTEDGTPTGKLIAVRFRVMDSQKGEIKLDEIVTLDRLAGKGIKLGEKLGKTTGIVRSGEPKNISTYDRDPEFKEETRKVNPDTGGRFTLSVLQDYWSGFSGDYIHQTFDLQRDPATREWSVLLNKQPVKALLLKTVDKKGAQQIQLPTAEQLQSMFGIVPDASQDSRIAQREGNVQKPSGEQAPAGSPSGQAGSEAPAQAPR